MYKDIITYELAAGVTEEHLFKVAKEVVDSWMIKQVGFMKWEILKTEDGRYTDIVYWVSKEAAKMAEANMANIPNGAEWYASYKEGTFKSMNLHTIQVFE